MTLRVSGKNLDIGESLRIHVGTRIDGVIAKYAAGPTNGHVTVEREGSGFRTDCSLHLNSGISVQAEAEALDAYESFNKAADRIERRLQRLRRRVRDRVSAAPTRAAARPRQVALKPAARESLAYEVAKETGSDAVIPQIMSSEPPLVFAETIAGLELMSVSQAVAALDAGDAPFVIFRHAGCERPHIVYRRRDGHIGWINTAEGEPH
jgi:ribosomal subunit interface protein